MFSKGTSLNTRFIAVAFLSVLLMVIDANFSTLKPIRSSAGLVLTPLYWVAELPVRAFDNLIQVFTSRTEILAENEKLRAETLLIKRRLQKLALLTEQNLRLRELLNSSALFEEQVLAAELLGVDPSPQTHRIVIDKGSQHGVYLGQPVLDARGVVGQVVEVMPFSARVLLMTDTTHSLPVQVTRNGLRAIASGTGNPDIVELRYITDVADIKEGDLLITSGMGQRFPAGYPVAVVTNVVRGTGQPFATVHAVPMAALNRSRYFLLVFGEGHSPLSETQMQQLIDAEPNTTAEAMQQVDGTTQNAKPDTAKVDEAEQ
ncbi:MAG: rod shape-determining protein MreC [Gammaproteobacteria bacterium]|nr:rod shape-determining protein MreC [Gammaproteobacteria bacterium]